MMKRERRWAWHEKRAAGRGLAKESESKHPAVNDALRSGGVECAIRSAV